MSVVVLNGQLRGLAAPDNGIKADGNAQIFTVFICRTRRGEQLTVILGLLPRAEH